MVVPNRRFWSLTACLFAVLAVSGCAGGSISVGGVEIAVRAPSGSPQLYADPGVRIERPGYGPLHYSPAMELASGDIVETADGHGVIDYPDGSAVMLKSSTRVQLGSIVLFFGEIFNKVKSISRRGGGLVTTNEVSASVEGTEFGVRRTAAYRDATVGAVRLFVREGQVRCAPGTGAHWPAVTLAKGQALDVAGFRQPAPPQRVEAEASSRWADETERRLRKAQPRTTEIEVVPDVLPSSAPVDGATSPTRHAAGAPTTSRQPSDAGVSGGRRIPLGIPSVAPQRPGVPSRQAEDQKSGDVLK